MSAKTQHQKAESLRETEHFLEALKIYEQVIANYQNKKDYKGLCEAL